MDLELRGKKALVTGASYGLGRACAEALAKEGVSLAICSRSEDGIRKAASEIQNDTGVEVVPIRADLSSVEDLESLVEQATTKLGQIDILVVSTGHPPTFPFSTASDEQWREGIDLLLQPPITLSRLLLPAMKERKFGRVILIGSIFGIRPEVSSVIQSTLRTGLTAFTKCLAEEYASFGVTVNVVCPGYFDTPLVRNLAEKYASEQGVEVDEVLGEWREYSPSKRFGEPEELGELVAFLSSKRAELINGTSLVINA